MICSRRADDLSESPHSLNPDLKPDSAGDGALGLSYVAQVAADFRVTTPWSTTSSPAMPFALADLPAATLALVAIPAAWRHARTLCTDAPGAVVPLAPQPTTGRARTHRTTATRLASPLPPASFPRPQPMRHP